MLTSKFVADLENKGLNEKIKGLHDISKDARVMMALDDFMKNAKTVFKSPEFQVEVHKNRIKMLE